jgi:hypothetical protein
MNVDVNVTKDDCATIEISSIEDLDLVIEQIQEIKRSYGIIHDRWGCENVTIRGRFNFLYPLFPNVDSLGE